MNTSGPSRVLRIYLIAAAILGVLLSAAQFVVYRFCYDGEAMLYYADSVGATVMGVALFAVTVLCIAFAALLPERTLWGGDFRARTVVHNGLRGQGITWFASLFCVFMLGCYLLAVAFGYIRGYQVLYLYTPIFQLLLPLAAVIALVFFATQLTGKPRRASSVAICEMGAVALTVFEALNLYFDYTTPLLEPGKILQQLAMFAAVLYFLTEIRTRLDVEKPRWHLVTSALALVFLPLSSLTVLLCGFGGVFALSVDNLVRGGLYLALYLYVLMRSVVLMKE